MIRYALRCAEGHEFESWFQSAEGFDTLAASGRLECAVCGGGDVAKALMAPKVGVPAEARPLRTPRNPLETAIAKLREKVEATATYVGPAFAKEARAIHEGERPDRPIWGEANRAEVKSLLEDGVTVAPLPFGPREKAN
ncbi:DUF1178 family protein [Jannaschia sp. W003]|uniref:DUF1178 family protein n=1 Tax=Jannaschia sp. W003 TaxID=2867012 RepID=UPI0021A70B10|nr:DUF1178 family protein [Jannaschia sp. W003]UWQ20839.1 DUF1178 family protein [Jannaschia sp. W003]